MQTTNLALSKSFGAHAAEAVPIAVQKPSTRSALKTAARRCGGACRRCLNLSIAAFDVPTSSGLRAKQFMRRNIIAWT